MSATKSKFAVALFLGFVIGMPAADARITRIVVDRVEAPTFGGASFGNVGQYEKLVGRAYGELDPRDELNSGIVYIDKAPLNAVKRVEYSIDVFILKPIDMSRGNRTLLYDVVNRGDTRALAVFHVGASASNDPTSEKDAGDGFLMKQGYTVVASGWQGDVPAGGNRLVGHFPVATETGGRSITKLITAEYLFTKPAYSVGVGYDGGTNMSPYPAVSGGVSQARLLRRTVPLAARELNTEQRLVIC